MVSFNDVLTLIHFISQVIDDVAYTLICLLISIYIICVFYFIYFWSGHAHIWCTAARPALQQGGN